MMHVQKNLLDGRIRINIPDDFEEIQNLKIDGYDLDEVFCTKNAKSDVISLQHITYRDKALRDEIKLFDYGLQKNFENFKILSRKSRNHNAQEQYLSEYFVEFKQNAFYICVLLIQKEEKRFSLMVKAEYDRRAIVEKYSSHIFDSIQILDNND